METLTGMRVYLHPPLVLSSLDSLSTSPTTSQWRLPQNICLESLVPVPLWLVRLKGFWTDIIFLWHRPFSCIQYCSVWRTPVRFGLLSNCRYIIQVTFLFKMTGILGWQINGNKRLHTPSLYLCFPCLTAVLQRYRDGVCSLLFFHPYISSFVFLAAIVATITGGKPPEKSAKHMQ